MYTSKTPMTNLGPHNVKITAFLEQRVGDMLLGSFPTFVADLLDQALFDPTVHWCPQQENEDADRPTLTCLPAILGG